MHGVGAVTWDAGLAQKAQAWADASAGGERGSNGSPHDPKLRTTTYQGKSMGENMAFRPQPNDLTGADDAWYSEVNDCVKFPGCTANAAFTSGTGHFTAMVWKNVEKIGCAVSKNKGTFSGRQFYFYVCRYWPAPNYTGQFKQNVLGKVKTESQCKA
jgi:uncharacterized protein YkwD